MPAPGKAVIPDRSTVQEFSATSTSEIMELMLRADDHVSDLIFSPGRMPQVETHGRLAAVQSLSFRPLTADDTRRIASDLIGSNKPAITMLREQGSCDISYGLPGVARFRVNIFIQRGSCAVIMRVIPGEIPSLVSLGLPAQLAKIANLRDGIVLVTGPRGSGKSSTLAAILDHINQEQNCHIITIEDPIEFLHNHKRATVHQRELHSDTPSLTLGMRAALRQSPSVIMIGEMHDRETIEMVLQAAETGHLVLTSMNTVDAATTVDRIASCFPTGDQTSVRERFAKTFRYIISQRLMPSANLIRRVAAVEVVASSPATRTCILSGENLRDNLLPAIKAGAREGMQHFDGEIEKLVRAEVVELESALANATDPQGMRKRFPGLA
ncbi:MAG: type IV pilus twitching motility protein PilT, partial [Terriglobales bacterium]